MSEEWPDTADPEAAIENEVVISYFSRTGTTASVAVDLQTAFDDPVVQRIRPTRNRRYPNWLLRSFVPGSTVPIEPLRTDLNTADLLVLGTPKWTVSCPPVTEFIERADLEGLPVGLVVTFGGFDERRYARSLEERLREAGAETVATLLVKRDRLGSAEYEDGLDRFVATLRDRRSENREFSPR